MGDKYDIEDYGVESRNNGENHKKTIAADLSEACSAEPVP